LPSEPTLSQQLLDALPQTQCTRCGYPDCAAYANAIAHENAPINRCPPGGAEGIARLAGLTQQPAVALDPAFGTEAPRHMAFVDEAWCIGCTLCLKACPVDAIIGTNKRMHTVLEAHCTGCELCIPACPVDCIHLENTSGNRTGWAAWSAEQAHQARQRYARHQQLQQHPSETTATTIAPSAQAESPAPAAANTDAARRAIAQAALARARTRASTPAR
jgi:electron transport complex protein RnfB